MTQTVEKNHLPVGGDLYITSDYASINTIISTANSDALHTGLLGASWKTFGLISSFQDTHIFGDEEDKEALNCGVGVYASEANRQADVTTTLLELNNVDVMELVMGFNRETVTWATVKAEILGYDYGNVSKPINSVLFVSCSYKDKADTTTPRRRDIIVASKQVFNGELANRYLRGSETFEGAEMTLSGKDGGKYRKIILKGATEAEVAATVTTT